jgi:hypothetical protein
MRAFKSQTELLALLEARMADHPDCEGAVIRGRLFATDAVDGVTWDHSGQFDTRHVAYPINAACAVREIIADLQGQFDLYRDGTPVEATRRHLQATVDEFDGVIPFNQFALFARG